MQQMLGTTIVAVKKDGKCAVAGDGQVTFGENTIMKHTAKKVRRIYHDSVVTGFAGTVADAFSLLERFEAKLEKYSGSLKRAAVSLAQEWRTDKVMRQLNAMLIVADKEELLIVSGTGEVIDPDDGIAALTEEEADVCKLRRRKILRQRLIQNGADRGQAEQPFGETPV